VDVVVYGLDTLAESSMGLDSCGLEGRESGVAFRLLVGGCLVGIIGGREGRGCRVEIALSLRHSGLAFRLDLLGCVESLRLSHLLGGGLLPGSQSRGYVGRDRFGCVDGLEVSLHCSISSGLVGFGCLLLARDAILVGLPALGGRDGSLEADGCT